MQPLVLSLSPKTSQLRWLRGAEHPLPKPARLLGCHLVSLAGFSPLLEPTAGLSGAVRGSGGKRPVLAWWVKTSARISPALPGLPVSS